MVEIALSAEMAAKLVHLALAAIDDRLFDLNAGLAPFANSVGKHHGHGAAVVLAKSESLIGFEVALFEVLQKTLDKMAGNHPAPAEYEQPFNSEPDRDDRQHQERREKWNAQSLRNFDRRRRNGPMVSDLRMGTGRRGWRRLIGRF